LNKPIKKANRLRFAFFFCRKMELQKNEAVKLKPNISRSKYLSIFGYGALPHRPTKGLSGRPLETFGHKYLIFPEISVLLA